MDARNAHDRAQYADVIPLPTLNPHADSSRPADPCTVLSLRGRLYERIFEEAWAEWLERERGKMHPAARRLRVIR
jgi:hypothetical protein